MSLIEYHKDTTRQLLALEKNVRNLVEHWPEAGRYKEAVLKSMIRRFLPEKYTIANGFVISPTEIRGEHHSSKQIDLIVYDSASPVIFKEGDFVILTPDGVRAIVEVKANMRNQDVTDVIKRANENGQFICHRRHNQRDLFFNGIFSFHFGAFNPARFAEKVTAANADFVNDQLFERYKCNHIALNKDHFLKHWRGEPQSNSLYRLPGLAFSFFIANLMATLANESVESNNFIWFADDKEQRRIHRF